MAYVKIIEKESGERSRIVVTNYALPGLKPDIGVDVFTQKPDEKNWELCVQSSQERELAMAMSVDDFVKNGRHPMFNAVTPGDLLKAKAEANRFGYSNPPVEATLHFTDMDGRDVAAPVIVDTATGLIEGQQSFDKVQHLQFGQEQLKVESNSHQQSRVIDLPELQRLAIRHHLNVERSADKSYSPSF